MVTGIIEYTLFFTIKKLVETGFEKILVNQIHIDSQLNQVKSSIEKIDAKIDKVDATTQTISEKISEQTLEKVRAAKASLIDFINASDQDIRSNQFSEALNKFTELTALDDSQSTSGTSGKSDNKYLISCGHFGKFCCFCLKNDKSLAVIEVYQCVGKWVEWGNPLIGLGIFPSEFFSKDYKKLLDDIDQQIEHTNQQRLNTEKKLEEQREKDKLTIFAQSATYLVKGGLKVAGVGTLALGSGAALLGRAPGVAFLAKKQAEKLWEVDIAPPFFKNIEDIKTEINNLKSEIPKLEKRRNNLCVSLKEECRKGLCILQQPAFPSILRLEKLIDEAARQLPEAEQAKLKDQMKKLETRVLQSDTNLLKNALDEMGETLESVSSVVDNTSDFIDKANDLIEKFGEAKKTLGEISKNFGLEAMS